MKSLKYMIEHAVLIAGNEPEAYIGVFCDWQEASNILQEMKPYGNIKWQSREFVSLQGARIKFVAHGYITDCCGSVYSHVFVHQVHNYQLTNFIKSRLRSTKKFNDYPMGYFDEFGVTRIGDY